MEQKVAFRAFKGRGEAPGSVTPKKRAVPLEQVHFRNSAPSPSKKSRTTRTDSSTEQTENGSANTGDHLTKLATRVAMSELSKVNQKELDKSTHLRSGLYKQVKVVRATTTRIDKVPRLTEEERVEKERNRDREVAAYKDKYRRAFPNFIFYLDGFAQADKDVLKSRVEALGGRVEPFFSKTCTHLVSERSPLAKRDANVGPGIKEPQREPATRNDPAKALRFKENFNPKISGKLLLNQIPIHSDRNPFDESSYQPNDILSKAISLKIRIWQKQKFLSILDTLEERVGPATTPGLSQLLQQEKIYGTVERDAQAQRQDFYYFPRGSFYFLVEDATGEHRPIAVEEHRRPNDEEDPSWPVLRNHGEGRCPFSKCEPIRKRFFPATANAHQSLRRSASLNYLNHSLQTPEQHALIADSRREYPLASGNSNIITSNVGSTTSAFTDTAHRGQNATDPRLAHLHRKTLTTGVSSINKAFTDFRGKLAPVRELLAMRASAVTGRGGIRRSVSVNDATLTEKEDKRPGYCENCRVKYDGFSEHVVSRRHRKFAENERNFRNIDQTIDYIRRRRAGESDSDFDYDEREEECEAAEGHRDDEDSHSTESDGIPDARAEV